MIDLKSINDSELIMLYHEDDEEAKNILFMKYKCIIDILINKYRNVIKTLGIDFQEVYSECTVGFSDALNCYQDDKKSSLPSFLTLCVERKIIALIRKYNQQKNKIYSEAYSLDFMSDNLDKPLMEILSDKSQNDPLNQITDNETFKELYNHMKVLLSPKEFDVFLLLLQNFNYQEIARILNIEPKKVDNTIQRIRNKVKMIIKK